MKKEIPISFLLSAASLIFIACSEKENQNNKKQFDGIMNGISEEYVKLILNIGMFDPEYVDAYYGSDKFKPPVKDSTADDSAVLTELYEKSGKLLDALDSISNYDADEIHVLRYKYLYKQLLSARTKIFMLRGGKLSFDEESKALYDAVSPEYQTDYFLKIINELEKELPGKGEVGARLIDFMKSFIIPKERLDTVFNAAIAECRKRTLNYIELPRNENFKVEYVTDKPWGGYNWYKGNFFSLIQVNTDLPVYINRAVDLAAHEGYPGHHVYNVMLESKLVKNRGWLEYTVYPLNSPQSFIAEGSANFGIQMAFPDDSRVRFEKEVLFPLAGLDASKAEKYYRIMKLISRLSYAENEAARNYIDGIWTKEETTDWLKKYSLMSADRAEKYFQFILNYRSYVINYNLGEDMVRDYINSKRSEDPGFRWKLFEKIISTPQTPSGLQKR